MFNKKGEISLMILAVIGVVALLVGAGAIFFWQTGSPQDMIVNYESYNVQTSIPQIESPAIVFNNITLLDSTQFDPVTNTCTALRHGMLITIKPCVAHSPTGSNIQHNVNFTWTGASPQNTSWIFVYDGQLQSGSMGLWQNTSHVEQVTQHDLNFISGFQLTGILNFTNLGAPNQSCQLGSPLNNTQMYNVNLFNATAPGQYTPRKICFTSATPVNATTFSLSGYVDNYHLVNRTVWGMGWHDITSQVQYMGFGLLQDNRSYYRVSNVTFQPGQSFYTLWTYTPLNQTELGKWHILGYNSNLGLTQAIVQDAYIYVDPWWNNNWEHKKAINVSNTAGRSIENFTLFLNVTFATGMNATFSDLRFVNGTETVELPYHIYQKTDGVSAQVRVNMLNLQQGNQTIYLYYGNPTVQSTSNANTTYPLYFDCDGTAINGFDQPSSIAGGICQFDGSGGGGANYVGTRDFDVTQQWVAYSEFRMTNGGGNDGYWGFSDSPGDSTPSFYGYLSDPDLFQINAFGASDNEAPVTWGANFYNFSMIWNASSSILRVGAYEMVKTGTQSGDRVWSHRNQKWTGSYRDFWVIKWIEPTQISYLFGGAEENAGVQVALQSPENAYQSTNGNVNFTWNTSATGSSVLSNTTLFVYNTSGLAFTNTTQISGVFNQTTNSRTFPDGSYIWGASVRATDNTLSTSTNRTFIIDNTPPTVTFNSPPSATNYTTTVLPFSVLFNATASDPQLQACWFTTSDNATATIYSCNTIGNATFATEGLKTITAFANDSLGSIAQASRNISIFFYSYLHTESVDPVAEGGQSTFTLYLNMTNIPGAQATFRYNNTNFAPSTQVNTQNSSIFTYVLNVPVGYGNSSGIVQFYNWTFNITGIASDITTNTQTQTVFSPGLSNCLAGGTQILNFTHRDEATKQIVNFSNGNNLQIDLTLKSLIDDNIVFRYNATRTNSPDIVVCVSDGVLNSTSYRLDLTGSYVGTGYVQEFFYIDNGTIQLSSSPQRYNWYDLLSVDSTTFLFTFLDENGIEVPGVIVETLRYYIGEGQFLEVERSKEDNNGETHIHLVEEDVIYKFRVTLNNQEIFLSDQYNAKCLSSPCSISLSAQPETDPFPTVYNNLPEGSYRVVANQDTREVTLFFNLNQTATMNLTVWTNDNNEVEPTVSGTTTASSGQITVVVPLQYGNATYSAVIYMNQDFVASRVVDLTEDANDYFGALGLFLAGLAVLCLALIGASHGEWVVIWTILGMITVSVLFLVDLEWYALLTFIAGAGIFLIKLVSRRRVG